MSAALRLAKASEPMPWREPACSLDRNSAAASGTGTRVAIPGHGSRRAAVPRFRTAGCFLFGSKQPDKIGHAGRILGTC